MFSTLKKAVEAQFEAMKKHELYRVQVDKDLMYNTYLGSFPEGTNPTYKERTEHDCQCCKSFIRAVGGLVTIIDGKLVSIWDVKVDNFYQEVANALSALVKSQPIDNLFLHTEPIAGLDENRQMVDGKVVTWRHFFIKVPTGNISKGVDIGTKLAESRSSKDVFLRSLTELTLDSVNTVLELIGQNSLYRGEEHKFAVESFRKLKVEYDKLKTSAEQDIFCWSKVKSVPESVARIRNTSIGTLLTDLSEGKDLEYAVKSFESKVAPSNYKRPTALITKAMIENAKKTIIELGFESALERRYATIQDITINNILFADRDARKAMKGDVFDALAAGVSEKPKNFDKVEEVQIDKFIQDVLPKATSLEVLLDNNLSNNLVSLIAPVDPAAKGMFKWLNNFSWSYAGEMADSDIRAAVKARGGRVDGVFRFSHSWNHNKRNASLMDLHVFMPDSGHPEKDSCHDTYGNGKSRRVGWNNRQDPHSGGVQDVDYTAAAPVGYVPVENITFPDLSRMPEGVYSCKVHNWNLRPPTQGGFKAEIEFGGQVFQYEVDRPLRHKEWVTVARVTLKKGVFSIEHCLPAGSSPKEVWGLTTQKFHRVSTVMLSPNHWDDKAVGNKHYFFMLDGCINGDKARGFFNEFLSEELTPHRKVLEMVGSKMKTEESPDQLSGIGFSSTQRNSVLCRVGGSFSRVVKITF